MDKVLDQIICEETLERFKEAGYSDLIKALPDSLNRKGKINLTKLAINLNLSPTKVKQMLDKMKEMD